MRKNENAEGELKKLSFIEYISVTSMGLKGLNV